MFRVFGVPVASMLLAASGVVGSTPSEAADPLPPEAVLIANWPLDGDTSDFAGDHDLTLPGAAGEDYEWIEDSFCFPESALELYGTPNGYAVTSGPVVPADVSFSVAAWVVPGATASGDQTVLSQAGAILPAVALQQTAEGSWRFTVPSLSPVRPESGVAETAPESVLHGVWNHLAGVVDVVEGDLRLYVNGELAAEAELPTSPWRVRGPLYLGVAASTHKVGSPFGGTIEGAEVWSGRLLPSQIRDMGRSGGLVPVCR